MFRISVAWNYVSKGFISELLTRNNAIRLTEPRNGTAFSRLLTVCIVELNMGMQQNYSSESRTERPLILFPRQRLLEETARSLEYSIALKITRP
jgi:hypothetical protein